MGVEDTAKSCQWPVISCQRGNWPLTTGDWQLATDMYDLTTTLYFAAAHQLRLYDGSLEPLHGHNWRVRVCVSAEELDAIGVVMDFHELERLVKQVIDPMHNRHLNDLPAFNALNPTTEHVAMHIARSVRLPNGIRLKWVRVWEAPENSAAYYEEEG
jgi:6-pyruvoyltetrahydropterin/6-carboxytetrahydropterin synthase